MVLGGAILAKKGLDKGKKSFDNYINKERDKGFGGNTRPGADQIYFGDKKKNYLLNLLLIVLTSSVV